MSPLSLADLFDDIVETPITLFVEAVGLIASVVSFVVGSPLTVLVIAFCSLVSYGLFAFIWANVVFRRQEKALSAIPGPRPEFIYGNARLFYDKSGNLDTGMIRHGMLEQYKKYGGVFKLSFGTVHYIYLCRADYVEALLSKMSLIKKAEDYEVAGEWLGNGLITSDGEQWKTFRKLLTPAFHFKILEDFIPIMNEHSMFLRNKLAALPNGSDVFKPILYCSLDTIMETAMGVKLNSQMDPNIPYVVSINMFLELLLIRLMTPIYQFNWLFKLLPIGRKFDGHIKVMHSFTNDVIAKRKREVVAANMNKTGTSSKKRLALLDLLLEHHIKDGSLTEEDIREQVDTFTFAGHDTTGVSITYTLYEIGRDHEIQKKVHEELDEIFGSDRERFVTTSDILKMTYLDAVTKESLRIYPPAPIVVRELSEDLKLDHEITIPKGTRVAVPFLVLHRDEDVFPDPENFDPERFTGDNSKRHSFAYCPFSAGPRNCIGQKLAQLEQKVVLANILRKYSCHSIDARESLVLAAEVVLRPKCPIRIDFTERT